MNKPWITNSAEDSDFDFLAPKPSPIPFDTEHLAPLAFKPLEEVAFAVESARQLLAKRTNEQCIAIAKAVTRMDFLIKALSQEGAMSIGEPNKTKDAFNNPGRVLFEWMDTFEFKDIGCPKAEWFEVFAVQTLMLCMEYSSETPKLETECWPGKVAAIIDCIARAEVLQKHGPMHKSAQSLGRSGGKGRTKKQEPLEREVNRLYLSEYLNMPVLKAANCIALVLEETQQELLLLTKNKNKAVAIQNIIRKLKAGKSTVSL